MQVLFIPGLGYNHRIFENLDLPEGDYQYIRWVDPKPDENLHDYALRIFSPFENSKEETILIGHSLGGMVAQEIASARNIKKVILISSIKSRKELPLSFKIVKLLHLEQVFNKEMSIKSIKFWGKNHGFVHSEDIALFKDMLGEQSNVYLKWALRQLVIWQEPIIPSKTKLIHIHGTNDKTFPGRLIKQPDFLLKNGSHIMVYKQPDKITPFLSEHLSPEP